MNSPRFSIIIPVYNSRDYIQECIESLVEQSYKEFEVIFINDGSIDDSGEICENIVGMYSHVPISVYHQENLGQIEARYCGIRHAKGEYCCFLDSDDTLTFDALEELSRIIDMFFPDVIIFNGQRCLNGDSFPCWPEYDQEMSLYVDEDIKQIQHTLIFSRRFNNLAFKTIRTAVLKKSLIYKDVTFIREEEDLMMQLPFFDNAKSIVYLPKLLYNYRLNPTSITGRYNSNRFLAKAYVLNERQKFAQKWELNDFSVIRLKILAQSVKRTILSLRNIVYNNRKLVNSEIRSIAEAEDFLELYNKRKSVRCDMITSLLILLLKKKAYVCIYFIIMLLRVFFGSDERLTSELHKKYFSDSLNG